MSDPYDEIPYFTVPHLETHPRRMEVNARLMGLRPADASTARVLEIGCADGGNLIPLAAQLPNAELVGLESSAVQVAMAQRWLRSAGVTNVQIVDKDVRDVGDELGSFDYIIAHGVYSWIPQDARQALLDVVRRSLRPGGVAYISYNVMPGWHLRSAIRHMMLYHGSNAQNGAESCRMGAEIVRLVADGAIADAPYKQLMKNEATFLEQSRHSYFFHDHLSPTNQAFYFHEFVEQLQAADLAFLSEALLTSMMTDRFDGATQRKLAALGTDILRMEQYQDFLTNRSFRRSLVVHAAAAVDRDVSVARMQHMFVAAPVRWEGPADLTSGVDVRFSGHSDGYFYASDALIKAMWFELGRAWPGCVAIEDLVARACSVAGQAVEQQSAGRCLQNLLTLYGRDFIELLPRRRPMHTSVSDRPKACPVARSMARHGSDFVTTRLQTRFALSAVTRAVLMLLNGQRTVDQVIEELDRRGIAAELGDSGSAYARSADARRRRDLTIAVVVPALTALADAGVLVA